MRYPIRRKDRAMAEEGCMKVLSEAVYGTLSTVDEDGTPYGIPLSFVWHEKAVYFHCACEGHKIDNIARSPRVCFSAAAGVQAVYKGNFTTCYSSVVVIGTVRAVEGDEKDDALKALCLKYLPEHSDKIERNIEASCAKTAVYAIVPELITGKERR